MENITSKYSPLILNVEWSSIWRLFLLVLFTATGTIMNGFFIATFFTSKDLKKKGHIFMACLGASDFIITGMVVPSVIVVMMSRMNETTSICRNLQLLTEWSTYAYSVFFMLVSIDINTRLLRGYTRYTACLTYPFCIVVIATFLATFATAGVGVYFDLDYDYCRRRHHGNYRFRLVTAIAFYVIPSLVTSILLLETFYVMKNRVVELVRYKRCHLYEKDRLLTNLHLTCYFLFVGAWVPYLLIVNVYPDADDAIYYAMIWIGLTRSGLTSFVYSTMNADIRVAFYRLFVYFCCKDHTALAVNTHQNKKINNTVKADIVVSKANNSGVRDLPFASTL